MPFFKSKEERQARREEKRQADIKRLTEDIARIDASITEGRRKHNEWLENDPRSVAMAPFKQLVENAKAEFEPLVEEAIQKLNETYEHYVSLYQAKVDEKNGITPTAAEFDKLDDELVAKAKLIHQNLETEFEKIQDSKFKIADELLSNIIENGDEKLVKWAHSDNRIAKNSYKSFHLASRKYKKNHDKKLLHFVRDHNKAVFREFGGQLKSNRAETKEKNRKLINNALEESRDKRN